MGSIGSDYATFAPSISKVRPRSRIRIEEKDSSHPRVRGSCGGCGRPWSHLAKKKSHRISWGVFKQVADGRNEHVCHVCHDVFHVLGGRSGQSVVQFALRFTLSQLQSGRMEYLLERLARRKNNRGNNAAIKDWHREMVRSCQSRRDKLRAQQAKMFVVV